MDNAMTMAGHGRAVNRRILTRFAVVTLGVSLVVAVAMVLAGGAANAQIDFDNIICAILLSLANAFGGFFAFIFNALLAAFDCVISG
jgi:hypothetical protein